MCVRVRVCVCVYIRLMSVIEKKEIYRNRVTSTVTEWGINEKGKKKNGRSHSMYQRIIDTRAVER